MASCDHDAAWMVPACPMQKSVGSVAADEVRPARRRPNSDAEDSADQDGRVSRSHGHRLGRHCRPRCGETSRPMLAWCDATSRKLPIRCGVSAGRCRLPKNLSKRCLSKPISAWRSFAASRPCCTGCEGSPRVSDIDIGSTKPGGGQGRPLWKLGASFVSRPGRFSAGRGRGHRASGSGPIAAARPPGVDAHLPGRLQCFRNVRPHGLEPNDGQGASSSST